MFLYGADARFPEPGTMLTFTGGSATTGSAGGTVPVEARLVRADGAPLAGAEVTFTLGAREESRIWTRTTDAQGLARPQIMLPTDAGFYRLAASYLGEDGVAEGDNASMMIRATS